MLQVHSSNHLESLLDQLLTCINQGDPFCAEVIVVENPGMSRWLQQVPTCVLFPRLSLSGSQRSAG